jgi:hypothetical protein
MDRDDVPFACVDKFYPKHFVWVLHKARLIEPFPVYGQLRLFQIRDKLIQPMKRRRVGSSSARKPTRRPAVAI